MQKLREDDYLHPDFRGHCSNQGLQAETCHRVEPPQRTPTTAKLSGNVGLKPGPINTMPSRATWKELLSGPQNWKTPACSARLGELQA